MVTILMALDDDLAQMHTQVDALEDLVSAADEMDVFLLHVFDDNPGGASVKQVEAVREAKSRLESLGVSVELLESSGDPAAQILSHAAEHDVDQISVGGRKRSPAGKALFGSVTQQVILGTDLPVLVCGSQTES